LILNPDSLRPGFRANHGGNGGAYFCERAAVCGGQRIEAVAGHHAGNVLVQRRGPATEFDLIGSNLNSMATRRKSFACFIVINNLRELPDLSRPD